MGLRENDGAHRQTARHWSKHAKAAQANTAATECRRGERPDDGDCAKALRRPVGNDPTVTRRRTRTSGEANQPTRDLCRRMKERLTGGSAALFRL